jgi:hypothetical protein
MKSKRRKQVVVHLSELQADVVIEVLEKLFVPTDANWNAVMGDNVSKLRSAGWNAMFRMKSARDETFNP